MRRARFVHKTLALHAFARVFFWKIFFAIRRRTTTNKPVDPIDVVPHTLTTTMAVYRVNYYLSIFYRKNVTKRLLNVSQVQARLTYGDDIDLGKCYKRTRFLWFINDGVFFYVLKIADTLCADEIRETGTMSRRLAQNDYLQERNAFCTDYRKDCPRPSRARKARFGVNYAREKIRLRAVFIGLTLKCIRLCTIAAAHLRDCARYSERCYVAVSVNFRVQSVQESLKFERMSAYVSAHGFKRRNLTKSAADSHTSGRTFVGCESGLKRFCVFFLNVHFIDRGFENVSHRLIGQKGIN